MRYCKRFYCDEVGDRVCCPTCWLRRDCAHPCLNHPARCGLEDKDDIIADIEQAHKEYTKPIRRGGRSKLGPKK